MNKKFIIIIQTLALALMMNFIISSNVFAAANNSYSVQLFKDDVKFNLPVNTTSYWFNLPKGFELGDNCNIELHFTFSNTLINERSNMTVLINDYPIDTKWIYDLQKTTSGLWKVSIPASKLRLNEVNEIKFQSDQRSIEGDCADIDNPSNWVVLHKDSKLNVTVSKYPDAMLSNFYSIYYDNFLKNDVLSSDFIVPKKVDNNSVAALLKIASSIGKLNSSKDNMDYKVLFDDDKEAARNKIYIGPSSFLKNNSLFNSDSNKLSKDEGYLSILKNDDSSYSTVITGENENGINKAADFISSDKLMELVTSDSLKVTSKLQESKENKEVNAKGIYKFSDFGYSDVNLSGAFHQKTDMNFDQPNGVENINGSYIELKFKHSKVLDSDRSIITVYINGIPVNSTKLTVANAENGTLKVNIPESALKLPRIKVGIECYNYIGKVDCSKDYYDSAWTVINADSKLCLISGNESIQPTLAMFPYFYTKYNSTANQVMAALTDPSNPVELKAATMIATRAGQNDSETFDWELLDSNNELTSKEKNMNMIFLADYKNAKIPAAIKKDLPVIPLGSGNFTIKKDVDLVNETLKDKVLFEVIRSPWDTSKNVYVVLYDGAQGLELLNSALSDKDVITTLGKQVSVLDNTKKIHNIDISEKNTVKATKTIWEKIRYIEFVSNLPWWSLLIILVVVVASIVAIIHLRREKKQFEKAGKKLKTESGFLFDENEETEEDNVEVKEENNEEKR